MAYEDIKALQNKVERLRQPFEGGLIQLLRNRKANKLDEELAQKEKRNSENRSRELAMLLRGAETGMVGGPGMGMGALKTAPLNQFMPTDPEVQTLAAQLRLNRANQEQKTTDDIVEYNMSKTDPGFQKWMDRDNDNGVNTSLLQVIGGDGTTSYVQRNPRDGSFATMDGQPWRPSQSDRITNIGSPQGAMSDVLPPTREADRRANEGAVMAFNSTAGRIIDLIKQNPNANTFMSDLSGMASGLLQEASAAASALGVPPELFDPASYQAAFRELGVEDAAMQSLITSLAFQAAQASGQGGRSASNADVARFIRQIGANRSDPKAFLRAIEETTKTVNDQYKFMYESTYGEPFSGDLRMPAFDAPDEDGWSIVPNG